HSLISCASMLRQLTPSLFPYTTLFRSREQRVEARVRALQVEDDRIRVRRLDTLNVDLEGGAADEPVGLHVRLGREDNVVGGEFHAVAPVDALAQAHRHLGEVVVVDRRLRSEGVVPYTVQSVVWIDVPERIHRELVEPGGLVQVASRGPNIEPIRISYRTVRVFDNEVLVARNLLRRCCGAKQRRARQYGKR